MLLVYPFEELITILFYQLLRSLYTRIECVYVGGNHVIGLCCGYDEWKALKRTSENSMEGEESGCYKVKFFMYPARCYA